MLPQILVDAYRSLLNRGRIGEGVDKVASGLPAILGYGVARDEKPMGTAGGGFTAAAWQTRDLGGVITPIKGFVVTGPPGRFQLNAGTWLIVGSAPAFMVGVHQTRIYNISDAAIEFMGCTERSADTVQTGNRSHFHGIVTPTVSPTIYEVQHRSGLTRGSDGFGRAANWDVEVYTVLHAIQLVRG